MHLAVLFEFLEVLFQFAQEARCFVGIEFKNGVDLVGGTGLFGLDFLFALRNFELERGDNRPRTELAQVRALGAEGNVLVRE